MRKLRSFFGVGTIPANTGRISTFLNTLATVPDHPREYGENYIFK